MRVPLTSLAVALSLASWSVAAWAGEPGAVRRCTHAAEGGEVRPPPNLFGAGGALVASLDYLTSLDADGRTLFCFQTEAGLQSPTLHVRPGDTLNLAIHNRVPALPAGSPTRVVGSRASSCASATMTGTSVNVHFHGTNTAPTCRNDDVLHTLVNSGETFDYHLKLPADEPAGLYWYHPHVHGLAEEAVLGGASGLMVVDGIERVQPELAGLPERLLIVRDQLVAAQPVAGDAAPAWDVSLNGVPVTYPTFTPAAIRMAGHRREFWRLANASADTVLDLELVYDGVAQPLEVVAMDGVPIGSQDQNRHGHPVTTRHILLPPAGRAEFVIPAPPPGTKVATLRTRKVDTGPLGDNDPARPLARLWFDDAPTPELQVVPAATDVPGAQRFARSEGFADADVTAHRRLYFSEILSDPSNPASPTNFFITVDGATPTLFDGANPPAIVTTKGAVEDWVVENRSGEVHEFHVHQIHFEVLRPDGTSGPPDQRQFRDTVQVPYWTGKGPYPRVRLRMDFRGKVVGDYVYHCHILGHEDHGMMAVIRVLPAG